jgi:hypothetical protein
MHAAARFAVHAAHAVAVGGGEYRPEYDQAGERERPETEVFPEGAQAAFGTRGEVQDKVAGDRQCRRREQRQNVQQSRHLAVERGWRWRAILLYLV